MQTCCIKKKKGKCAIFNKTRNNILEKKNYRLSANCTEPDAENRSHLPKFGMVWAFKWGHFMAHRQWTATHLCCDPEPWESAFPAPPCSSRAWGVGRQSSHHPPAPVKMRMGPTESIIKTNLIQRYLEIFFFLSFSDAYSERVNSRKPFWLIF